MIFRPRFFRNRRAGVGSVSRLTGSPKLSKLKNPFLEKNRFTRTPAKQPHTAQETIRTARASGPSAVL